MFLSNCLKSDTAKTKKTYNMHYAFFLMFNFLNQMLIFELMQILSMEMIFNIILMNSMN